MEETPSNAVLLAKLESMSAVVLANQTQNQEDHKAIIIQTIRINGRVSELEKWKNITLGFVVFANLVILPIALALLNKYLSTPFVPK